MSFELPQIALPDLDRPDVEAIAFDLSNRETASLIYIGLLLAALLIWKDGRRHVVALIKAFFQPALSAIWVLMSAYAASCVLALAAFDAWEWDNLKTTLLWWVSVGFASMWEAQKLTEERGAFRRLLRDTFNITVVIVFLAEVKSFPLWGEMILLPVLTVLGLMLAIAQTKRENAVLIAPLQTIMALIGIVILWNGISGILDDPSAFFTWNTVREFSAPIFLSLMFIPFIYALAIWIAHESIFTRAIILGQDSPNTGYARRKALFAFGGDIEATKRFSRELRVRPLSSRSAIDHAIYTIKRLNEREKAPPPVAASEGWSPYDALTWLNAKGIYTSDWHACAFDNEWTAAAYSVAISDRPMADRLSYYVTGTELAATRLRLALDAVRSNDPTESDQAFYECARVLLARVFGEEHADRLAARVKSKDQHEFKQDDLRVCVEWRGIGDNASFGHQRNLEIIHPAHTGDN